MRIARLLLACCAVCAIAGTPAFADDASLRKDMAGVIALLGLSCGDVTQALRRAENDNLVTCSNGTQYRVFVTPAGRVLAQKLPGGEPASAGRKP